MDFTLGTQEEALEAANQAERTGGNFVKEPGAYFGPVETAIFKKFPSGAGGMEIAIKTENGQTCKVMIITMKKDGTSTYKNDNGEFPLPGINQIRGSLMPVLRQKDLTGIVNGDEITYPTIIGKKIGMLINIRKTLGKTNGKPDPSKVYDNADIKTFYCPATNLCGSEILAKVKEPKRMAKILETLKVIDETQIAGTAAGGNATNASDPFGESAGETADDPFGGDTTQDAGATATAEAEAKAKADAEVIANAKVDADAKMQADAQAKAAAAQKVANDAKAAAAAATTGAATETASDDEGDFWD